jgi:hypothetical protein
LAVDAVDSLTLDVVSGRAVRADLTIERFAVDGFHPGPIGRERVAVRILDLL